MEENNNNFLDKNTLFAIVLSMLVFIGWQAYLQKKYPNLNAKKKQIKTEQLLEKQQNKNEAKITVNQKASKQQVKEEVHSEQSITDVEKTYNVELENLHLKLSTKGMGLNEVKLNDYSDRNEKQIIFHNKGHQSGNFATLFNDEPVHFKINKESDLVFTGTAEVSDQVIIKKMIFNNKDFTVNVSIKTLSGQPKSSEKLVTLLSSQVLNVTTTMLTPSYDGSEFFVINDGSEERERIDINTAMEESYNKTTLTSIGSTYFAIAVKDNSAIIPQTKAHYSSEQQVAYAKIIHEAKTEGKATSIEYVGFMGPKKYDLLKTIGPEFVQMINYGIFSILSEPILLFLKWLFRLFKNWGLAIIFLTISIRLILLPISISSIRSMKKMQKIQPQLKALKEKYKEDPQKMNMETMALMKKEKANPLGGCLPMLLQLPVFFALYSVLGQSVELYKSPFAFWIKDLSYQDPYFVLPIAVGGLYYIQMNLTPQTTMDPAQAKVMKFIPLLFCFFMITVPSGLTLYFFVNTVFSIIQQLIFQKEKKRATV